MLPVCSEVGSITPAVNEVERHGVLVFGSEVKHNSNAVKHEKQPLGLHFFLRPLDGLVFEVGFFSPVYF